MDSTIELELAKTDNKRVLRSMPGRKYDSLYYNRESSSVELVENSAALGKYKVNLASPVYSATSSVTIPNSGNFVGKCFLHIEIPAPVDGDWALTRGWGLALINNVELLYPNSNVSSIRIERSAIWHSLYSECQTVDSLDTYMRIAGEAYNGVTVSQDKIEGKLCADLIIELPWSNYCSGMDSKLYFDTSLLTSPFTVNITFNNYQSIFGTSYTPTSNSFSASFFYRELDLSNKNASLRNTLFSSPGMSLSYPSVHRQSYVVNFTSPSAPAGNDPADYVEVNLQSFINADLLSLNLSTHLRSELLPTGANLPVSPWNALPMYDVELTFGGEVIYSAPRWSYRLINQESNTGVVYAVNDVQYSPAGVPGDIINGAVKSYVVQVDMSRLRQICRQNSFSNTIRYNQQQIQLKFRLPSSYLIDATEVTISELPCSLLCTYMYPQVLELNSSSAMSIYYN